MSVIYDNNGESSYDFNVEIIELRKTRASLPFVTQFYNFV